MVVIGLFAIAHKSVCNTAVQMATPSQSRGRVIALYVMLQQGTTPFGAPLVGWLGSEFGARWSVMVGGFSGLAAGLIGAAVLWLHPSIVARFEAALRDRAPAESAAFATEDRPSLDPNSTST